MSARLRGLACPATSLRVPRTTTIQCTRRRTITTVPKIPSTASLQIHSSRLHLLQRRAVTSTSAFRDTTRTSESEDTNKPNPRWLDDLKARLGKCLTFGCNTEQVARASAVLSVLATEWRDLLAGSNGFLTPGVLSPEELGKQWGPTAGKVNHNRMGLLNHTVAWGEMDSFGHVNNTVYNKWAETARVNWLIHFAAIDPANAAQWRQLMTQKHIGFIMQSILTQYKVPIVYPDHISVYFRTMTPMNETTSALKLESLILSHRHKRIAATTTESVVVYDYQAAKKTNLPDFAWPLFDKTWKLQQIAQEKARERIAELMREVVAIEKETWDRDDAVEDLGGKR